jgi:hypothetical protein
VHGSENVRLGSIEVEVVSRNRGSKTVSVRENRRDGVVRLVGHQLAETVAERFIIEQQHQEVLLTKSGKISPLGLFGNVDK